MYKNDPREITVKWPAKCAETGKQLHKGDKAIYYPTARKGAKLFHPDSDQAQQFREWKYDCDVLNSPY